jgi:ABC-type dipeptide/oligopeptide/nickel transport system permease component
VTHALQRLAIVGSVLVLVVILVFSLTRIIPGDPAVTLLGPGATNEQIEALRRQLNLDRPIGAQFSAYVAGLVQGDLGRSIKTGRPVLTEIMQRLPATLELAIVATFAALLVGIPLGVLSAVWQNSWLDHLIRIVSLVGVSAPAFLLAIVLQLIFAISLGWLPVSGRTSPFFMSEPTTGFVILDGLLDGDGAAAWDGFLHVLMPMTVLASFLAATLGRYVRTSMLEVLGEDYVRTARAKGLNEGVVIFVHGLRNAMLPAITVIGLRFAEMLGGAILTETIFAWPGIGRFMFEAIRNRDYPVIQGTTLVFALMFIAISLAVDMVYAVVDPRLRRKAV